jgi:hypothetical protein
MYLPARTEQFDVKGGDGGIRVPNLLHVHRATIAFSRSAIDNRWSRPASRC